MSWTFEKGGDGDGDGDEGSGQQVVMVLETISLTIMMAGAKLDEDTKQMAKERLRQAVEDAAKEAQQQRLLGFNVIIYASKDYGYDYSKGRLAQGSSILH